MTENLKPATWGVTHGSGYLGGVIRRAQIEMSKSERFPEGDAEASWAGHVIVYVGVRNFGGVEVDMDHAVVSAQFPRVVMRRLSDYPDAIWATGQKLTTMQRTKGTLAALTLLNHDYDALAYAYFIGKVAKVAFTKDLGPLLAETQKLGPICSGVMVRSQEAMDVDLGPLKTAAIQDPDFVSPADSLRWGLDSKWMSGPVPAWTP